MSTPPALSPAQQLQNKGGSVVAATTIFSVLATFSVALRIASRCFCLKSPGLDEAAIVVSLLCSIGVWTTQLLQVKYGLGKHSSQLQISDFEHLLKLLWISILLYTVCLCLAKMSIVFQYLRVFVGKRTRIACWLTLVYLGLYSSVLLYSCAFICVPVQSFWQISSTGKCFNYTTIWFIHAGINISTDLIIFVIPLPVIKNLHLPFKSRVAISFIFGLGLFGTLVSILRLHSLYVSSKSHDLSYDNVFSAIWSNIELNVGIICACLPTIKPIISRFFPRLLSTHRSTTKDTYDPNQPRSQENGVPLSNVNPFRKHGRNAKFDPLVTGGSINGDVEKASAEEIRVTKSIHQTSGELSSEDRSDPNLHSFLE